MDLREFSAIRPLHFFALSYDVRRGKKVSLTDAYGALLEEEPFYEARVALSEEGVHFDLKVQKAFEKAHFPDIEKGDGLELFLDTRGIQDAAIVHKYCHHFVFLPKEVDGMLGAEVTHFKTNDKRDLAPKELLQVTTEFSKARYQMEIFIPDRALFGFDLSECPHLKIAYMVHRGGKGVGGFPKSVEEYNLKDHPSLWADLQFS